MAKAKETVATGEIPNVEAPEGSAVTIITNTVESLRGHYPSLVAQIENAALEKAKPEWVNSERDRLSALNAAFANDPKFANECFTAGLTVEQSKAKRHDDLVAKLAEAEAKIAKASSQVPFASSDGGTAAASTAAAPLNAAGEPLSQIESEARKKWNSDKSIESEFGEFKIFLAYEKARANKSFKVLERTESK